MNYVSHLECPKCGREYSAKELHNLCQCGSPLLVKYHLEKIKTATSPDEVNHRRDNSMWRYKEFLPHEDDKNIISLGEGDTPIYRLDNLGRSIGLNNLFIKDEGLNPTGTFKARGAAAGVTKAKELGAKTITMPSAGNAAAAWTAYTARAGLKSVVVMPEDAPEMAKKEAYMSGAEVYLVDGLISDAGEVVKQLVAENDWYEVTTLKEPYRLEGKKTMGLEIAEFFDWEMPDVILYPTGGGVGIIGIWKAMNELAELGWLKGKKAKLVAVQSTGCDPIVRAFKKGKKKSEFQQNAKTIAGGIRVPKSTGDFLVLQAVYETGGTATAVSDKIIKKSLKNLSKKEGLLVCPEGASLVGAVEKLKQEGLIDSDDRILLLNTGSGLKYPDLMEGKYNFIS